MNAPTLGIRLPALYVMTDVIGIHYLVSNLFAIGSTFGSAIWSPTTGSGRVGIAETALDRGRLHYDIQG